MMERGDRPGDFRLLRRTGRCVELVTSLPELTERTVVVCDPKDQAVILGSTQRADEELAERCRRLGFEVVRRRSGGGGVVVEPGTVLWIDYFLPSGDPLFENDVRLGSFWVGEVWLEAVSSLVPGSGLSVHRDGVRASEWSDACCFLGIGPGEVANGERKVVGLSQRRSRAGGWFFTLCYLSFDPVRDAALLVPSGGGESFRSALASGVEVVKVPSAALEREVLSVLERRHGDATKDGR